VVWTFGQYHPWDNVLLHCRLWKKEIDLRSESKSFFRAQFFWFGFERGIAECLDTKGINKRTAITLSCFGWDIERSSQQT